MKQPHDTREAGQDAPGSSGAPAGETAPELRDGTTDKARAAGVPPSEQALRTIEGERKARDYLARLQARQAGPDELALVLAPLYGAALRGFCRVLASALEANHG